MVLYGGLAVTATGGSTIHATSPTKAGESHTITYSRNVQLFIGTILKIASRSRENISLFFETVHSENTTSFLHSRSKNNDCEKSIFRSRMNCSL